MDQHAKLRPHVKADQYVKILLTDEILEGIPGRAREWYPTDNVLFVLAGGCNDEEVIRMASDVDVIMNMRRRIERPLLEASQRLCLVQQCGVGVDNIDLKAADALGIRVANSAGSGVVPVAEHAIMLMLALTRQLSRCDQTMRRGEWIQNELFGNIGELYRKTLGIVGFGRIGQRLARIASLGFDMRVQYFDKFAADTASFGYDVRRVTLEELLHTSDYVSIHCNLSDETRGLIGRGELGMMKPNAFLINTARGAVVDEEALVEALRQGRIKGAGLDVFGGFNDRLGPDCPLAALPNVVLTPHIATMTPENLDRTFYDIALRNVMSFASGQVLRFQVNAPAVPRQLLRSSIAHLMLETPASHPTRISAA